MSTEKKYVLDRLKTPGGNPGILYRLDTPHVSTFLSDKLVVDVLRTHPEVEDRTHDYSDVPLGTAGTASMNDGENAGEFRAFKVPGGFDVITQDALRFVPTYQVTNFTPDRVVDEELIGEVARACRGGGGTWTTHAEFLAATVERILRGES